MKELFVIANFKPGSVFLLVEINHILEEYEAMGYDLTLRQLYYQMVSRDLIENSTGAYKKIGGIVNKARLGGLIDWDMIVDRGRTTKSNSHWENPRNLLMTAAKAFQIDKWLPQPSHIEVMCEKDALSGVLEPVCRRLDVNFTANKGYSSQSAMYEMAKRLEEKEQEGKEIYILYLGDHDPSGIDMSRDIEERLYLLSSDTWADNQRLALNIDQINRWKPPENPAKTTDSRYEAYRREFGTSSWELDAIEPAELDNLVTKAVIELRDESLWEASVEAEMDMKSKLMQYASRWGTE